MFEKFTNDARRAIQAAKDTAVARGDRQIGAAHLLYALTVTDGAAARALAGLGVSPAEAGRAVGMPGPDGADTTDAPDAPGPLGEDGAATGADSDAEALRAIGIDLDEIRRKAEESFGPGALERVRAGSGRGVPALRAGRLSPLDRDVRQALAMSLTAARALHSGYIGTEHVLLGLVGAGERPHSAVPALLRGLGLEVTRVRERVLAEAGIDAE